MPVNTSTIGQLEPRVGLLLSDLFEIEGSNDSISYNTTVQDVVNLINQLTSPLSNKGDIFGFDGINAVAIPVGNDGEVLTADDSNPNGVSYQIPESGITSLNLDTAAAQTISVSSGLTISDVSPDHELGIDNTVVATLTDTQILTNKTLTSPVLTTPFITDFTNATHDHASPAGGGQLVATSALSTGGTPSISTFLRGDDSWATVIVSLGGLTDTTQTLTGGTGIIITTLSPDHSFAVDEAVVATATNTLTFTNKSIDLTDNTLTGTLAQFNIALSDATFATLDGIETLTNKTLTLPVIGDFTNASHNHQGGAGAETLVATSALTATGTKDATTFLRGDNTWDVPSDALWTVEHDANGNNLINVGNLSANQLTLFETLILPVSELAVSDSISSNIIIGVTVAGITVTIETTSIIDGRIFIIKDQSGGAASSNITVEGQAGETIDGLSSVAIVANFGVLRLYAQGGNLFSW